jgi:hypothetical protein
MVAGHTISMPSPNSIFPSSFTSPLCFDWLSVQCQNYHACPSLRNNRYSLHSTICYLPKKNVKKGVRLGFLAFLDVYDTWAASLLDGHDAEHQVDFV